MELFVKQTREHHTTAIATCLLSYYCKWATKTDEYKTKNLRVFIASYFIYYIVAAYKFSYRFYFNVHIMSIQLHFRVFDSANEFSSPTSAFQIF